MQSFTKASSGLDKTAVNRELSLVTGLGRGDRDEDFETGPSRHKDGRRDDGDRCKVSRQWNRSDRGLDRALCNIMLITSNKIIKE